MRRNPPDVDAAHRHCALHAEEIQASATCGCFYGLSILFRPFRRHSTEQATCRQCAPIFTIGAERWVRTRARAQINFVLATTKQQEAKVSLAFL